MSVAGSYIFHYRSLPPEFCQTPAGQIRQLQATSKLSSTPCNESEHNRQQEGHGAGTTRTGTVVLAQTLT